jgi:hypothetical protein
LDLDLAGDDRLLLAGPPRLQGKPLWLLLRESVLELFLEYDVKFAHVILAKAVFVPADDLEQEALLAEDGQFERLVPFRVQLLVYGRSCEFLVAEREDKVLWTWWLEGHSRQWHACEGTHGVRSAAPVLCSEVSALHSCQLWLLHRGDMDGRTLMTFALKTRPGTGCSGMARSLGLPVRLAGTEVGVELGLLV